MTCGYSFGNIGHLFRAGLLCPLLLYVDIECWLLLGGQLGGGQDMGCEGVLPRC